MLNASRAHLAECREGYLTHLIAAVRISATLLTAALACTIHAFVPGLFVRSASMRVERVRSSILARKAAANIPHEMSFEHLAMNNREGSPGSSADPQIIFLEPPVRRQPAPPSTSSDVGDLLTHRI